MEPSPTCEEVGPEQLSVILVPFVALDSSGSRLGHGGGFYDRYLVHLRPEVMRVAVGFKIQLVPEVPSEPHDVKMDALVTEAGVRRFARV
jgi:5-formyltetrahydrofolate cyclo-ligase